MRLLIAILEEKKALEVRLRLYGMDEHWDVRVAENGLQAAALLETERWDVLLLDSRLVLTAPVAECLEHRYQRLTHRSQGILYPRRCLWIDRPPHDPAGFQLL